jgi:hypothetical protein
VVACVVVLPATAIAAPIVSFNPSFQAIGLPGNATVDIVVSNLAEGQAVGSFDLDITFAPGVVGFTGYSLGTGLGTGGDVIDLSFGATGGVIDFAAVSLLDPGDLSPLQGSSFVLGTLHFGAVANGLSPLTFTQLIFADQDGIEMPVEGQTGAIQVGDQLPAVPEPATMVLFGLGTAMLGSKRWLGRRKNAKS